MGARGRHPMPAQLKLLTGETKKSRINLDPPKPMQGAPELPDVVTADVRQVWHYTVAQLDAMGLLSPADRDTLLCYCEAVVAHRRASEAIAETGLLIRGSMGSLVKNPACNIQHEAASQIARYSHLFGLTPSARSEIRMGKVRGNPDAPSADRFLTG